VTDRHWIDSAILVQGHTRLSQGTGTSRDDSYSAAPSDYAYQEPIDSPAITN
jgi:hypothetical protein